MDPHENIPWLYRWPVVRHYYGDTVRQLFLAAAVLMLVGLPIYADSLDSQGLAVVVAAVVLTIVAGVMNPKTHLIKFFGVAISLVGAVAFELWALSAYLGDTVHWPEFLVRELIAGIFIFALYFSTKTWRSDVVASLSNDSVDTPQDDLEELVSPDSEMDRVSDEIGESDDSQVESTGNPL